MRGNSIIPLIFITCFNLTSFCFANKSIMNTKLLASVLQGNINYCPYCMYTIVGVDSSIVPIVRCKILYQMILNQANSRSILQVWFSTGWSMSTLKEFYVACNRLLGSKKFPKNEADLVRHWLTNNVTLTNATNEWFKGKHNN